MLRVTESLPPEEWRGRADRHAERADRLTAARRRRAARGERHPVDDFLFTYYGYKPSLLRRWHGGAHVELLEAEPHRAGWRWYITGSVRGSLVADAPGFEAAKPQLVRTVEAILRRTSERRPQFGCFGLHEWAMVYRSDRPRHDVPLRLGRDGTDSVVESHELRCTHFDAFRFFTAEATPRNALPLTRDQQIDVEQPGCLHAGMDVYKWAMKLGPLVPGELLLDAFELARDIRQLDMEASPYDLTAWDVAPVAIETREGKAEYMRRQQAFTERAEALRRAVLSAWRGPQRTGSQALHG